MRLRSATAREIDARGDGRARAALHAAHNALNALAAVAAARAVGVEPGGPRRRRVLARCAASGSSCRAASSSSTTATTPTRCRCAPPSTTSPRPRPGAASPCSATCSSSGPTSGRFHARDRRPRRATPGVDLLVTVGAARRALSPTASTARSHAVRRRREAAAAAARALLEPGDTVLVKGSRGVGLEVVAEALDAGGLMGEVLIARHGLAAHLRLPVAAASSRSCATASSASTSARRARQGHHAKAGTPTMGGIIIFLAISVPFLILTRLRLARGRRLRRGDRLRAARLRRRLHEDRQAPLARPARRARS